MISAIQSPSQIIVAPQSSDESALWLRFFDPLAALEEVVNHIESLPGSRFERHTMRAYLSSLADFCGHLGARVLHHGGEDYTFRFDDMLMPTKSAVTDYIARCKRASLSSSTITRYMAAVRLWLRALEEQPVTNLQSGQDMLFVMEAQRQFRLAAAVKNPAPDRTSNRPALEQHGTRLTLVQVNTLLESFTTQLDTLTGKRDLAMLYLGISSGLRAAELARLTLNSITPGKDCYEVRVRGKRNNHDPIGIDSEAFDLIHQWVSAWNAAADPAYHISGDVPLFQPLLKGGSVIPTHDGLSARAVLQIVNRRTAAVLGKGIGAHDLRRTCAYLMRGHGFEWDQIRAQLRHRSIATTEKYVGQEQDLSRALLSKRVTFSVPHLQQGA